jgi:hypothetical protein
LALELSGGITTIKLSSTCKSYINNSPCCQKTPPTPTTNTNTTTMADQVKKTADQAGSKWDAMSEDQKKQTFDSLPQDKKQGKSYTEWVKEGYNNQYENWMPWIEDQYLKWFTNDNKTSYAAKGKTRTLYLISKTFD